ncbi:MFS transporter [Haloactinomyces albus]|uniref:MFS family permease n=1 Tax=Haloactinomyces albus TaxID=1352928 RepID=A0AAE3ZH40_9ACTN|nr:aromatic acid/H+ symport family MFS transporter [Haloactinomyces albus]MDR7303796.1 MFS family permease [Haloactinomyces albus]
MTSKSRLSWPAALCWLTVMLEGFDLVALGAVGLALQDAVGLEFTPTEFTMVATVSLVGVMVGAAFVTPLADVIGRRKVLIASVASFSLFTLLIPLSPNVEVFAALRLLAGIGLGACMPTALAVMSEYLPPERRARANTTTMTGYHCGAVAASLMALAVRDTWQVLFVAGGAAGLILAGIMWSKLPETASVQAPAEKAEKAEKVTVLDLLRPRFLRTTLSVWVATFMGLLLVYGLNTWLPSLMETAGYDVSTSITLLFVLNAGGVLGMFLAGHVGDTRGISRTILIWFGLGAVLLAALSIRIQVSLLLNAVIFLAGVFVFSAQVLVYAYIAQSYPERIRGSALGITSAVGRFGAIGGPLITGVLVSTGVAYPWGFYFFAAAALLGLLAMAAAPWVSRNVGAGGAASESVTRTPAPDRV